jgi:hypothetical protein
MIKIKIETRCFTYGDNYAHHAEKIIRDLPEGNYEFNGCSIGVYHDADGEGGYFHYEKADHAKIYS